MGIFSKIFRKEKLTKIKIVWTPYIPGILLLFISFIITLFTYKDYGISWDEKGTRSLGTITYDYVLHGNNELFNSDLKHYGSGFELLLVFLEKAFRLTDTRYIYLMRHLAVNVLFLISALCLYALAYKLFKNKFIASLGFIMLVFAPRLYAHSFYNSRDLPFLSMFIISLFIYNLAFEKKKNILFVILGMSCAYTTSIRIMGIMLGSFIFLFLLIDMLFSLKNKGLLKKETIRLFLFLISFCITLYTVWPYLWPNPISNFSESFSEFSRYPWEGNVLLNGKLINAAHLPWTYFPIWFLITNPEVWLIAGIGGILLIMINFIKTPLLFLKNTVQRNFLLSFMCFFGAILAVILLHSILYTDWRHLYFVYPPFVILALYFIHRMLQTKYRFIVRGVCILQIVMIGYFMIKYYPFSNAYFNSFVSHKNEYLRDNYGMDLWGSSVKQGLDHILQTDRSQNIKVGCVYGILVRNNIMLLPKDQRDRIQYVNLKDADYGITCYNEMPNDFCPAKVDYTIKVLNSSMLSTFKLSENPPAK